MPATCQPLEFRAAFPDEAGRAAHLDGGSWKFPSSRWFVAIVEGPPERIVGAIRWWHAPENGGCLEFRVVAGPGGEISGNLNELLEQFLAIAPPSGLVRYADILPESHLLEEPLLHAGFSIRYREQRFVAPWDDGAKRIAKVLRTLERKPSPLDQAEVVPIRHCAVEMAVPLLCETGLMPERELRSMWNSSDPTRLDRDASACLMLNGKVLGVMMCAAEKNNMLIRSIAASNLIPGARRRAFPRLVDHLLRTHANTGYTTVTFRANVETARQTVNFAQRSGGTLIAELRRWGKTVLQEP